MKSSITGLVRTSFAILYGFAGCGGIGGVQIDFEVLALADFLDAGVAEGGQRAANGLALGIENGLFRRYVDESLHIL